MDIYAYARGRRKLSDSACATATPAAFKAEAAQKRVGLDDPLERRRDRMDLAVAFCLRAVFQERVEAQPRKRQDGRGDMPAEVVSGRRTFGQASASNHVASASPMPATS